jgi:L-rhamnose mutarotase
MIRKAFVMSVNAGCEDEYERRHNPIWAELERALLEHGVKTYSIFLHPETRQLFGYVEFADEEQWNAIAETPVCRRWWRHLRDLMPAHPDDRPISVNLREVFHLRGG